MSKTVSSEDESNKVLGKRKVTAAWRTSVRGKPLALARIYFGYSCSCDNFNSMGIMESIQALTLTFSEYDFVALIFSSRRTSN